MEDLLALELVILAGLAVYGWLRQERRRTSGERWMKRRWRHWRRWWRRRQAAPSRGPLHEVRVLDRLEVAAEPTSSLVLDERAVTDSLLSSG